MTEPPPSPEPGAGGPAHDRDAFPGMPRWVKFAALVVGILIVAVLAVSFLAGGNHGPGRHGAALPGGVSVAGHR